MTREELVQDLSYVRAMAEEGRHAPLLGGSFLLFWGLLNAAAYLVQWLLLTGQVPGGSTGIGFAVLWIGYGVIGGVGSGVLGRRVKTKPGKSAIGVRAEHAVWRGVGIAIGAVAIGCILRMFIEHDAQAPNTIMGPAFALFGASLTVTSMMSGQKWLGMFAALSYAAAILFGVFANETGIYLVAAAASLVVLAAPGIVLLRREPSAVV